MNQIDDEDDSKRPCCEQTAGCYKKAICGTLSVIGGLFGFCLILGISFIVIWTAVFYTLYNRYDNVPILASYDFIIVGAGAAGSVVANRLSENGTVSVLLIEAGDDDIEFKIKIPADSNELIGSEIDWRYSIVKKSNSCLGNKGWPRVVGGSTAINWMADVRWHKEDYNSWEALGNTGWGYKDVLTYFKKSERAHMVNANETFHGKDGIWKVHYPFWANKLVALWASVGREMGFGNSTDYNGEEQEGTFYTQQSLTPKGERSSTSQFVYPFVKTRGNFMKFPSCNKNHCE